MPHAKNKVDWCLRKAQKELEHSDKHRGLVRIQPNRKIIKAHIKKAEHNLHAMLDFKEMGYSDWSAPAAFYSIYHSFLAVLAKFGYESRNQECTFALMYYLIDEGKIELDKELVERTSTLDPKDAHESPTIIDVREAEQYGVALSLEDETFDWLLTTAKHVLDQVKICVEQ